jgi:hypothetical protein
METYRKREAARVYGKTYDIDLINPEETCKLIWDAWAVRGLTFVQMAAMTGIQKDTLRAIYHQRRRRITRATHEKIVKGLAEPRRAMKPTTLVDADPHRWKISCLLAQGWRQKDLEKILGDNGKPTGWLRNVPDTVQFTYRTVKLIDWLVNVIGDRHGPSRSTANRMLRLGFFPLIHYTENGQLIVSSLTPEQLELYKRVQSIHGESSGRGNGPRPHTRR